MYGGNQHSTIDQGWIGWFCQKALEIKNKTNKENFTISGTGKQVRDVLHAEDVVSLYFLSVENIEKVKGQAFNIGGGIENSLSLLELFGFLDKELNIKMEYTKLAPRESDQLLFIANNAKITEHTSWTPKIDTRLGLKKMINWLDK
jgi:CDP-paratose 2-epimerase